MDDIKRLIHEADMAVSKGAHTSHEDRIKSESSHTDLKHNMLFVGLGALCIGLVALVLFLVVRPPSSPVKVPQNQQTKQVAPPSSSVAMARDMENPTPDELRYVGEATDTLSKFDQLHAALEVGVSYLEYSRRVADLNYSAKAFLEKNESFHKSLSYAVISKTMAEHIRFVRMWDAAISSHEKAAVSTVLSFFSQAWPLCTAQIRLGKLALSEKEIEKRKEILARLRENDQRIRSLRVESAKTIQGYITQIQDFENFKNRLAADIGSQGQETGRR